MGHKPNPVSDMEIIVCPHCDNVQTLDQSDIFDYGNGTFRLQCLDCEDVFLIDHTQQ